MSAPPFVGGDDGGEARLLADDPAEQLLEVSGDGIACHGAVAGHGLTRPFPIRQPLFSAAAIVVLAPAEAAHHPQGTALAVRCDHGMLALRLARPTEVGDPLPRPRSPRLGAHTLTLPSSSAHRA